MKQTRKRLAAVLAALMASSVAAGCNPAPAVTPEDYFVTEQGVLVVKMSNGTEISLGALTELDEATNAAIMSVGIASIEKTGTDGGYDVYTVTLSNGKTDTFVVEHSAPSNPTPDTPATPQGYRVTEQGVLMVEMSNGTEISLGVLTELDDATNAAIMSVGIASIEKTGTDGGYDVYTVTLTNGTKQEFSTKPQKQEIPDVDGYSELTQMRATYSPVAAANLLMQEHVTVSTPNMLGVHDAHMVLMGGKAYIVYEANDVRAGESAAWHEEYAGMSIVDLATNTVEHVIKIAVTGQQFDNETLQAGATFVPRIVKKDDSTVRIYFASEDPHVRQSLTYYIDYNTLTGTLDTKVYRLKLKTADGAVVDFTPQAYYNETVKAGSMAYLEDYGAYLFDIFVVDGVNYVALNNFVAGQNALAKLNADLTCIEIVGHIGSSNNAVKPTESGILRTEEGTWMAILREERKGHYLFSYSDDGTDWTTPKYEDFLVGGESSKPTLDNFHGYYFMGWNDVTRACWHLAYSKDCKNWTELYTFYSPTTFQYPVYEMYNGEIYYAATMGDKQSIVFGKLKIKEHDGKLYIDDSITDPNEALFADKTGYVSLGSVQANSTGATWQTAIKRDQNGVYFTASTDKTGVDDKLIFALDTKAATADPYVKSNMLFRFMNGSIEVRSMADGVTSAYRNLVTFPDVKFVRKQIGSRTEVALYVPYIAITRLAPQSGFESGDDELYFAVMGANGSCEYSLYQNGYPVHFANPTTYFTLNADGTVSSRGGYHLVTTGVKSSRDGATWTAWVKRDAFGVHLQAFSPKTVAGDKIFFMLDTQGTSTAVANDNNLMFKFEFASSGTSVQVQARHTQGSTARGYVELVTHPTVKWQVTLMETSRRVDVSIPYDVLKQIAPNATFAGASADLFCNVYAANGSWIRNITYNGTALVWDNPSTYLKLTASNVLSLR